MKREFKTTEFWTLIIMVLAWLVDRRVGTDLFSQVDPATLTEAKAQVLLIAANLREQSGSDSNLLVYAGGAIYLIRKVQKIVEVMKNAG